MVAVRWLPRTPLWRWAPSGPRARGMALAFWNLTRVVLAATALLLLVQIRGSMSWVSYTLAIAVGFSALAATLGLRRDLLIATAYLLGFSAFSMLRGMADETSIPVQYDYVIGFERLLPGPLPTIWIQSHLRTAGEVSVLDRTMAAVHLSYFVAPLVTGCAVWRWRREIFARYVVALLVVYYTGLVASLLLPTAPPWVASESGAFPAVAKVSDWVYGTIGADGYASAAVRMNPVAAMPSLHMAITTVIALVAARFGRWWAAAGAGYALLMAFALVYLGEHYVTDEIAGVLLGVGAVSVILRSPVCGNRSSSTTSTDTPQPEREGCSLAST